MMKQQDKPKPPPKLDELSASKWTPRPKPNEHKTSSAQSTPPTE
jgi:hypothetical protein